MPPLGLSCQPLATMTTIVLQAPLDDPPHLALRDPGLLPAASLPCRLVSQSRQTPPIRRQLAVEVAAEVEEAARDRACSLIRLWVPSVAEMLERQPLLRLPRKTREHLSQLGHMFEILHQVVD